MAYKVNYGPSGTTLIQVGTKFYLVYESEGKKLYWEVNKNELKNIVDAKNVSFDENGIISTDIEGFQYITCLLYTSPSPRDVEESRMPSSA